MQSLAEFSNKTYRYNQYYIFIFQITKLKIDSNPFAKGFRDSSRLTEFDGYGQSPRYVTAMTSSYVRATVRVRATYQ